MGRGNLPAVCSLNPSPANNLRKYKMKHTPNSDILELKIWEKQDETR